MSVAQHRPKTVEFECQDTRLNLPVAISGSQGEANFVDKFEKAYLVEEIRKPGFLSLASGREFALEGFGRADVLFMAWKPAADGGDFTAMSLRSLSITAIEGKMSDWRKGLMQASRYRFFANRSLLVLPPKVCATALGYLQTFRDLNVGLWQFNPETGAIRKHFTPRHGQPLNSKAREKAIQLISVRLKFR
jgi:hypothetical protein